MSAFWAGPDALVVPLLQRVDRSSNQFAKFSWRIHMRQRGILIYFYMFFNGVDTLVPCSTAHPPSYAMLIKIKYEHDGKAFSP
jgi:hypothetical protein